MSIHLVDSPWWSMANCFLKVNFSLSVFLVIQIAARLPVWKWLRQRTTKTLPDFPQIKNEIVLGSLDEGDKEKTPLWTSQNLRALNGNILFTGSIGTGKSQGGILPCFEQMLKNFDPQPSILAIDPKGTFVAEAKNIVQQQGLSDRLLWMSLSGDVTFNPIYHPAALKNSNFLDIAQMVRTAAVNFMGRSSDTAFWDVSAFNLIKNCLVYCAATQDYYTLSDLYAAMVTARDDGVTSKLDECLRDPKFTPEEIFNINQALLYFISEFKELDERTRSGILITATSFLNQFQEYRAAQIFCPPKDKLTIHSMNDVVDNGKILLFSVTSPGLARSIGTFLKLHYEQSILDRLNDPNRTKERSGLLLIDEYQDVVSSGNGVVLGDDRFLAKGREANAITIAATQSLTTIENSLGKREAAHELFQNFRTRIALQSTDLHTIRAFQECAGQEERERVSTSLSEFSQDARINYLHGDFESKNANLSESVNVSKNKEYLVTAEDFSRLKTFEAFAQIYDGVQTEFKKLFLKPHYLKEKSTLHEKILAPLMKVAAVLLLFLGVPQTGFSFPNVCTALNSVDADSCMNFQVSSCMCGWPVPRPCARFSYYLPQTFIEVVENAKETYFSDLPGAKSQLLAMSTDFFAPYGVVSDNDTQAFHAHVVSVPLLSVVLNLLPCRGRFTDKFCFDAMSEHFGDLWRTGSGDSLQPNWLAWMAAPQACLLKGAAMSAKGGSEGPEQNAGPMCSAPVTKIRKFPPSNHSACNGWGIFYPRSGVVTGPSDTIGALMIASRIKSLSAEVLHSSRSSFDELWQEISPQSSSCFSEGQNIGPLELAKRVTQVGRVKGKLKGHLFTVWQKYSCCQDLAQVPAAYAALQVMKATCQGLGGDL